MLEGSCRSVSAPVFSRFFNRIKTTAPPPSTDGRLIYAIGDVHGRLDVLEPLVQSLAEDALSQRPTERPLLIFLGDYVDRGPASAGVIDKILALKASRGFEVRALKGNHEEALLQFLDDPNFGSTWAQHGGIATIASYGVQPPSTRTDPDAWRAARDAFAEALPPEHLSFLRSLELMITVGEYAFVHAGVRPGVSFADQAERDMLWIRGEFLHSQGPFEKVIVHGHTPMEEPQITRHRLGIDTGVYATGVLTAVRLNGEGHHMIQAKAGRPAAAA